MITIIYVYGATGVCRTPGAPEFTAFSPHVVSADLQRFTARQDLAKLSRSPVVPMGCNVLLGGTKRIGTSAHSKLAGLY